MSTELSRRGTRHDQGRAFLYPMENLGQYHYPGQANADRYAGQRIFVVRREDYVE